jgi:hypothetical protein
MAKHKKSVGSGITERKVISYSGEDMYAAVKAFLHQWNAARSEGGGSFGAVVLNAERACRSILETEAGPPPFGPDSPVGYAGRILRLIEITKGKIARGDADEAARTAVQIGRLCTEAYMKAVWEKHALRGESNAARLKAVAARANKKRQERARALEAKHQAMAADMNPHLSARALGRRIAAKAGGNPNTIRRRKIKPK